MFAQRKLLRKKWYRCRPPVCPAISASPINCSTRGAKDWGTITYCKKSTERNKIRSSLGVKGALSTSPRRAHIVRQKLSSFIDKRISSKVIGLNDGEVSVVNGRYESTPLPPSQFVWMTSERNEYEGVSASTGTFVFSIERRIERA